MALGNVQISYDASWGRGEVVSSNRQITVIWGRGLFSNRYYNFYRGWKSFTRISFCSIYDIL